MGPFSDELWRGTDRLVARLESPAPPASEFIEGSRVKHPVFGTGTVMESDPDSGTVRVKFDLFGVRRISPEVLGQAETD